MAAETVGAGSGHPVLAALAQIERASAPALEASTWSLSDGRGGPALIVQVIAGRLEAVRGALLRESVSRETPTPVVSRVRGR